MHHWDTYHGKDDFSKHPMAASGRMAKEVCLTLVWWYRCASNQYPLLVHVEGQPGVGAGAAGGPFVVFDESMSTTLVFSPSSNFMTMTLGQAPTPNTRGVADNSFCFGLDGPVAYVPAGYKLQVGANIVHDRILLDKSQNNILLYFYRRCCTLGREKV